MTGILILWLRVYLQPPCQGKRHTSQSPFRPARTRSLTVLGRWSRRTVLLARSAMLIWVLLTAHATTHAGVLGPGVPDAESAMQAARTVQGWVRSGSVEGPWPEVAGASVILRENGIIIGQGESFTDPAKDLSLAARKAMLRALSQRDRTQPEQTSPGANITIDLELAGTLIPVRGVDDLTLALSISPGLDGMAVRQGNRVAARFPNQVLPSGQTASDVLRSLVSELASDPTRGYDELIALREAGYAFYRFRTVNLVQTAPGTGFIFAHRGGRVVERSEIDSARLRQMADGIARHLCARLWPGIEPYGLMGTLDPVTGRVTAQAEAPAGQAIATSALLRYARTTGVDEQTRELALTSARQILEALARVEEGETEPWLSPADAAATLIALTDGAGLTTETEVRTMFDRCAARVVPSFDPAGKVFAADVPESAWGLIALAMVRLADAGVCSDAVASSAVRSCFRNTPPERLVGQMPWLGRAEIEQHPEGVPLPSRAALIEMRRIIFEHQLDPASLDPADRDLAGSIVFTSGTTPLPTWNAIRPMPFLADMLGDARLTSGGLAGGEGSAELSHLIELTRYLHQLCAGPVAGHMYRRPSRSLWGVRNALWDQNMSIEASALGLESVCTLLDSVLAMSTRSDGAVEQNPPGTLDDSVP